MTEKIQIFPEDQKTGKDLKQTIKQSPLMFFLTNNSHGLEKKDKPTSQNTTQFVVPQKVL